MTRITDADIARWRRHGYLLIENFLEPDELAAAQQDFFEYFPAVDDYYTNPDAYSPKESSIGLIAGFPYRGTGALNAAVLHPDLVSFAERVAATPNVRMAMSYLGAKYGGSNDYEQTLHTDHANNDLAYPDDCGPFAAVPMFLYLSDVTIDDGPTYVVSQEYSRGMLYEPDAHERLREHEIPAVGPAGTLLVYAMGTFHRGSRIIAARTGRFVCYVGYQNAAASWMGAVAYPAAADQIQMRSFLESATPRQRELIGFPPAGSPYWNERTLAGVANRYPGLDLSPYRQRRKRAGN